MHRSVMTDPVAGYLVPAGGGAVYIDATVGSGGHAAALLERSGAGTRLLGIDRDPRALERAAVRLAPYGADVCLRHGCFAEMQRIATRAQWPPAAGIVMDLGVSTDQLADPGRGFSFAGDGPLDMRMDPSDATTAADLIATLDEAALCALFREYGEERAARRIARRIVRERERAPITGTARLAAVIAAAAGRHRSGRHPATRCFQALRIAVNRELEQLAAGLEAALPLLRPGGRLAVITFHSLEDRMVKTCFRRHAGRTIALATGGSRFEYEAPRVRIITRRPLTPDAAETTRNPRARSAKLRVVEREGEHHESNTAESG